MKLLKIISYITCVLCALILFNTNLFADNLLQFFHGGVMNGELRMNSSLTSGIGIHEISAGVGITTLHPSPASIYWNPAGLAFLKNSGIIYEAAPSLGTSPDMTTDINTEVDAAFENMVQDSNTVIEYPDFTFTAGQGGRPLASFAVAFPYKKSVFAVSYHRAFSLNIEFMVSGLENKISTIEEDLYDNSTIFTITDINLLLDYSADILEVGMGSLITPKLGYGITIDRIYSDGYINGVLRPDGMFTRRGAEKAFNDPTAGWQNDFYSSMTGGFSGGTWGIKTGFAYKQSEKLCCNLLVSLNGQIKMNGDMDIIQYTYPALNMNAEDDEENFDLGLINNFAQPTETTFAETDASNEFIVNTPSSFALGAAYKFMSLTVTTYFGELSYEYEIAKNGNPILYSRGLDLKYGFLFGLNFKYFRMGVGGINADEVVEGYTDENNQPVVPSTGIILPRFTLGTGFKYKENWDVDLLLAGVPDLFGSIFKIGLTYTID